MQPFDHSGRAGVGAGVVAVDPLFRLQVELIAQRRRRDREHVDPDAHVPLRLVLGKQAFGSGVVIAPKPLL